MHCTMTLVLIFRVNNVTRQLRILPWQLNRELDKTADILRRPLWFARESDV